MPSAIARSSTVPLVISYTTANSMVSSRRRNCRRARVDIAHSSTVLKHVTATSLDATPGMEAAIAPPSARLNAPLSTILAVNPRKVSVPATRTVGLSVGLGVLGDDEGRAEGCAEGSAVGPAVGHGVAPRGHVPEELLAQGAPRVPDAGALHASRMRCPASGRACAGASTRNSKIRKSVQK